MRSQRHSPFALVRAHHGDECVFDGRAPGPTTPDRNGARAENLAGEGLGVDAAARCDAQGRTEVRHLVHLGPSAQRVRSFRRSLDVDFGDLEIRSEEHTSELQSLAYLFFRFSFFTPPPPPAPPPLPLPAALPTPPRPPRPERAARPQLPSLARRRFRRS